MRAFFWAFLFLAMAVFAFSCKSTKKQIEQSNRVQSEVVTISNRELNTDLGTFSRKTLITERTIESYDQNLLPIKETTVTTEVFESENKNVTIKKAIEGTQVNLESFDSLSFNKETEGMEIVEEIVGGITGKLFGGVTKWVIASIFFVILLIFVKSLIQNNKLNT